MGKWEHRILEYDEENNTVNCEHCGWKPARKGPNGRPMCQTAKKKHKGISPLTRHGLTRWEAKKLREGKACEICGTEEDLAVDHNHETEKLRGILCRPCNLGLGCFKDNKNSLASAIVYLEHYSG